MKHKFHASAVALAMALIISGLPTTATAQHRPSGHYQRREHRQNTKNQWRDLAYLGAALGVLGAVNHDDTLTFVGAVGALYSANRYEQDRKSQRREDRARYEIFRRGSFSRNGHHYKRYTKYQHGEKYFYFKRED